MTDEPDPAITAQWLNGALIVATFTNKLLAHAYEKEHPVVPMPLGWLESIHGVAIELLMVSRRLADAAGDAALDQAVKDILSWMEVPDCFDDVAGVLAAWQMGIDPVGTISTPVVPGDRS